MIRVSIVIFVALFIVSCKKNRFKKSEFLSEMYSAIILPEITKAESSTFQFESSWTQFKNNQTTIQLLQVKADFKTSLNQIEAIQFYNLGEIQQTYIYNKFNKTKPDTAALWTYYGAHSNFIQSEIAALPNPQKGIYAVEHFLFAEHVQDSLLNSQKYRNFVSTLLVEVKDNLSDLKVAWGVYKKNFTEMTDEGVEGSFNIVNNRIVHVLEDLIDKRLNPVIESGNSAQGVGNSSGSFLENIKTQFLTIKNVYLGQGIAEFNSIHVYLRKKDKKLAESIKNKFIEIEEFQNSVQEGITYYLLNDPGVLEVYKEKLKELLITFKLDVFPAMDIVLTFGDTDGD